MKKREPKGIPLSLRKPRPGIPHVVLNMDKVLADKETLEPGDAGPMALVDAYIAFALSERNDPQHGGPCFYCKAAGKGRPLRSTCPVCEGTGRLRVSMTGESVREIASKAASGEIPPPPFRLPVDL